MKSIFLLLSYAISLFAIEPIRPIINSLGIGYQKVLTNSGKNLIVLNSDSTPSERQIIDLKNMSYSSHKSCLLLYSHIQSNSKFYIINDKYVIRLYNLKNPTQSIKVLDNKYKHIYLSESYLYGIEKNSTVIHIHTLPELKEIESISIPKTTNIPQYPSVIATDTKIYIQLHDNRYIIDIKTKIISDISDFIVGYHMQWILEDGTYIIGSIKDYGSSKRRWGVFNTGTLERNINLEKYLNEHPFIKHISKYNDDQIVIAHNAGIDFWDIKKHYVVRSLPLPIQGHFNVLRQNDSMIISKVFSPFLLIDLTKGSVTEQPYARHKPYGVFIENNILKTILRYSNTRTGIWNLIEHKWEYIFPEKIDPNKIQSVIKEDDYLLFIFSPGMERKYFPILQWSLSEKKEKFEYPTDEFNNIPNLISINKKHNKLMIHLMDNKFYIFDMKNGEKLHEFKTPDHNPNVYDLEMSDDGTKCNIYTADTKGFVKVEMGTSYRFDHKASIYSWSLADGQIEISSNENIAKAVNGKLLYKRNDVNNLTVKDNNIEIFWDENNEAMVLKKLNNPYRFIYLYTPKNASSWIDIDNQGYFDSSRNGENYIYQCLEHQCDHIDQETINYYKRKGILKTFLKK